MDYKFKYLKYKIKYNKLLKKQYGGNKEIAAQISDYVNSIKIFDNELRNLSENKELEFMFRIFINIHMQTEQYMQIELEKKKLIIINLLTSLKNKLPSKRFYHNIIRKNFESDKIINNIIDKTYTSRSNCRIWGEQKFINYPYSGMHTTKQKYFINKLPEITKLAEITTYNYVLLFVTDMETNQTYYYFVFVQYTSSFEYSIKHSNLRVFLPEEWLNNVNIDHGLIASGELQINTATKKIIFDFNSSSMIIKMYTSPETDVYKANYIKNDFITDYINFTINPENSNELNEQLLALTYIFVSNHMVINSIKKIIELETTYSEYTVEIHSDYKDTAKLLVAARNLKELVYTNGIYNDPHPNKLGGLHTYAANRCYDDAEIKEFNNASASEYQDLDDNNIDKINCITSGSTINIDTGNDKKNTDFIEKCKILNNI